MLKGSVKYNTCTRSNETLVVMRMLEAHSYRDYTMKEKIKKEKEKWEKTESEYWPST